MAGIGELFDVAVVRMWLSCTTAALLVAGGGAVAIDHRAAPFEAASAFLGGVVGDLVVRAA